MSKSYHQLKETSEKHCLGCPLLGKPHVVHAGIPSEQVGENPEVFFVGEMPGGDENAEGRPFVGAAGQLLRKMLRMIAEGRSYILGNVGRCRPSENNKLPSDEKTLQAIVSRCIKNTKRDILKTKPKVVVLLGATAVRSFCPNAPSTLAGARAAITSIDIDGIKFPAVAAYHPAYILRNINPETLQAPPGQPAMLLASWKEDLRKAFQIAKGEERKQPKKEAVYLGSYQEIRKFLKKLLKGKKTYDYLGYDTETTNGIDLVKNGIASINMSVSHKRGYVFLWRHRNNPCSPQEMQKLRKLLVKVFTSDKVRFRHYVAHNAPFDMIQTYNEFGVWAINRPWIDTMAVEHNFDCNRPRNMTGLDDVTRDRLGIDPWPKELVEKIGSGQATLMTPKELTDYGAPDAYVLLRLMRYYEKLADSEGRKEQLLRYLRALHYGTLAIAFMERKGAPVDANLLHNLLAKRSLVTSGIDELDRRMRKHPDFIGANNKAHKKFFKGKSLWETPWIFNPSTYEHMKTLIVDVIKIDPLPEVSKKTGRFKFDKKFFERFDDLEDTESVMGILVERRKLIKLRDSYLKSLPKFYREDTKRIHAHFNLAATQTGRLNSDKPNFQNMPKGNTPAKKAVKDIVCAEDGKVLVNSDFSQAEVRYVAEISHCRKLTKIFRNIWRLREEFYKNPRLETKKSLKLIGDIHLNTASMMFGVPLEKVTKDMRSDVKGIVFGLIYGMGFKSLAIKIKSNERVAEEKTDQFFKPFPEIRTWLEKTKSRAEKDHFVDCIFGRRRALPDFDAEDEGTRGSGRRKSTNTPIQNAASDHNLFGAGRLIEYIIKNDKPWDIVALVHDSIVGHIPVEDIKEYILKTKYYTGDTKWLAKFFDLDYKVKFVIDFEVGRRWASLIPWDGSEVSLNLIQEAFLAPENHTYKPYPLAS